MNESIFLGYVDSFEFKTPEMASKLSGHPIPGRVYRIIEADGVYRVHIGRENNESKLDGIILGDQLVGNFYDKWSFQITPINKDNYLDFKLDPEDLTRITKWLEEDNSDLKELMKKDLTPVPIENISANPRVLSEDELHDFIKKIGEGITDEGVETIALLGDAEEKELLERVGANLNFLINNDRDILKAFDQTLSHVVSCYGDKYEADHDGLPNVSKEVLFSKSLGKGANMYNAFKYLQRYSSSGFEKSSNLVDVYKAIHFLLFELIRVIRHGKA